MPQLGSSTCSYRSCSNIVSHDADEVRNGSGGHYLLLHSRSVRIGSHSCECPCCIDLPLDLSIVQHCHQRADNTSGCQFTAEDLLYTVNRHEMVFAELSAMNPSPGLINMGGSFAKSVFLEEKIASQTVLHNANSAHCKNLRCMSSLRRDSFAILIIIFGYAQLYLLGGYT